MINLNKDETDMNLINKFDLKNIVSNELYLGKLFLIGIFLH